MMEMMKRIIVDCSGGGQTSVQLTPEEIEQRQAEEAAWEAQAADRARGLLVEQLAASDYKVARITEDVITALVAKGTLTLADLPAAAVLKIADRVAIRNKLVAV